MSIKFSDLQKGQLLISFEGLSTSAPQTTFVFLQVPRPTDLAKLMREGGLTKNAVPRIAKGLGVAMLTEKSHTFFWVKSVQCV